MPQYGPNKEQRVLDLRMEYGLLATNFVSLANMFWVGFGAFFTINTLLATALGVSYADAAADAIDDNSLTIVHLVLPAIGIFISIVAALTGVNIVEMQRRVVKRGRQIETVLFAKSFNEVGSHAGKFPTSTTIGSALFGIIWAAVLYGAIKSETFIFLKLDAFLFHSSSRPRLPTHRGDLPK